MTAAELYAAEKVKHGVEMPRATGCPRRSVRPRALLRDTPAVPAKPPIRVYLRDVRKEERKQSRQKLAKRNAELVAWYESGMSLSEIGAKSAISHGSRMITRVSTLSRILRSMGVVMRPQGRHTAMQQLKTKYDIVKSENSRLRAELAAMRRKLAQEAA